MQYPDDVDEMLDNVKAFHAQMRTMSVDLPPTPAKTLIGELLKKVEPMVEQFRDAQKEAHAALARQMGENEREFAQANKDFDAFKQQLANVPPTEEIQKKLVPAADALPVGLSGQFAGEILNRYAPPPAADADNGAQPAAWQDWSVPS
ncbi:hypothetical protein [Roseimaritima ulvae]|uniref:Uncharacterized protein n=1 Tax=Roseimaritima ulvae TaxID=980254 RepID=A0A5B9R2Z3_9BACT|nr:hypothetical protein [Roseimaritima ulvae]QEG40651.1 hypothetical protein UC8_26680 [Roseimaritima ulvae]